MNSVLGINLSHDTSVCLIKDGVIYAAEEERWSKLKHNSNYDEDFIFPHNALNYVLETSETRLRDVNMTFCVSMSAKDILGEHIEIRRELEGFNNPEFISHHKAHILSAYLLSPFKEAVGLCIDGGGSLIGLDFNTRERTTGYYCSNDVLTRIYSNWDRRTIKESSIEDIRSSLGLFYLNFAQRCIPLGNEPEGSMMALSAFGKSDNNPYYRSIKKIITLLPNGMYQIEAPYGSNNNLDYFFNDIIWKKNDLIDSIPFEERANFAWAIQKVFEETVVHILDYLYSASHIDNLVFSGGCALNSKLNGVISNYTHFKNVYIPPAPHDGGTAVGAALYGWNYILKNKRIETPTNVNWGPEMEALNQEDINYLSSKGFVCQKCDESQLLKILTTMLLKGNVIIWARGKMEFGPRALGNRSIIAYPNSIDIRNRINKIKQRAWYRPLAPSVLERDFSTYFCGDSDFYMNKVSRVLNPSLLPAISHKDETARVQIVRENNCFYSLLNYMDKQNMVPIIINTSLNLKGKPIARNKRDVLDALLSLDVDAAVIDNTIIRK